MEKSEQVELAASLCEEFETPGGLSSGEMEFLKKKACQYHGVEGDVDSYIENAQSLTREIQIEFTERINRQTDDFIEIVEFHLEEKSLGEAECYAISRLVRFIVSTVDDEEIDEKLYRMADSMGRFFSRLDQLTQIREEE